MKIQILASLLALSFFSDAQSFVSLATDVQGDAFHIDAKELSYYLNNSEDTLFVKIEHYNPRTANFGFALALDTNLNPSDGFAMHQGSMFNQATNTSLNYDLALFAFQFVNAPGVNTEAYGANGLLSTTPFGFDTSNAQYSIFSIPLTSIGGNADLNLVAFTGTFTISPNGSGPSDAMPDDTFVALRASSIGVKEYTVPSLSVYPNPATDYLNIEVSEGVKSLTLTDLNGKLIRKINVQNESGFNTKDLTKGMYVLRTEQSSIPMLRILIQP